MRALVGFFRRAFLRHGPRRYAVMQPERADRKYDDFAGPMTDAHIQAHLDGRAAYAVPYVHAGLGHVLAFDIDAGGLSAATALLDAAASRHLWAFGQVDTARGRGYVWIPFDDLVNGERLRLLGDQLIAEVCRPPTAADWKIENRASEADTRLPFARHAWTGRRGLLLAQSGQLADMDTEERLTGVLERFAAHYRENPTSTLPPPPEPKARPERPTASTGQGITIAAYNARTDLVPLLEHYGAKQAKGQGARLYFCPFHNDGHASLIVSRDGQRCHCYSTGSDCPLSRHQYDAFNVLCIGEGLTSEQALRRLNGLSEEPRPFDSDDRGNRGVSTRSHEPRPTPGNGDHSRETTHPASRIAQNPQHASTSPAEAKTPTSNPSQRRQATDCPGLPKSARRVLDFLAAQPGDYCRGKYHLAEALDIDPRTVQRSLRRLELEGYLLRYQRGRDGQTDIYRVVTRRHRDGQGATFRVTAAQPTEQAQQRDVRQLAPTEPATEPEIHAQEGRHLPPTWDLDSVPSRTSLTADRGGIPQALAAYQAEDQDQDQHQDPDGILHGPAGALVIPGGAAWIPPAAESWYAALPADLRGIVPETLCVQPETEPIQAELGAQECEPAALPPVNAAPPTRSRRRRQTYVDPGRLHGRIIAAERKAAKLEAEGTAKARAQARAIRRQAEQLSIRLAMLREDAAALATELETGQDVAQGATFQDGTPPPMPPPLASLGSPRSGVDWLYLERLYRAGEQRGIEIHCTLRSAEVAQVKAELARRIVRASE